MGDTFGYSVEQKKRNSKMIADSNNCTHSFVDVKVVTKGLFGSYSEEIIIYCQNCGTRAV